MQNRRDIIVNHPALIPIAGNYDRKPRTLDREVTSVGRARGTDLCLEATEISVLHCLIYRTAEGYRIRDCNSRCGTRINGHAVKSGLLRDGDIINIGSFSFEFQLPPALFPSDSVKLDPIKVAHWKASRRRLAERVLKMRKQLRGGSGAAAREQELAQKAHLLKEKIRGYDQRVGELEAAEQELSQERRQLADETEKHRRHVQASEQQLAHRLAQADEEIRQRWQDFQKRCKAEEDRLAAETAQKAVQWAESAHEGAAAAQRQQEARDKVQHLEQLEEQLNRRHDRWQREQQEFDAMKEQWVKDQAKASATLDDQLAALGKQKAELVRMMGDLKTMQDEVRRHAKADARGLQERIAALELENAELRRQADVADELRARLQQLEAGGTPADDFAHQVAELRAENELLHEELQIKEQALSDWQAGAEAGARPSLAAENDLLKKLLEEKDRVVEEMQEQAKLTPKTDSDLERYEAELNEFRRQLESDRTKLNREVDTLRERNKELNDAVREMEMEMSKERAELARERIRLERVREEVKADMERLQREQAVRDTMAPVQKLRDELLHKPDRGRSARPEAPAAST